MEWVEGRNLGELPGLPPDEYPSDETLTGWFRAAAAALGVVHERKLAHLDVTPNNLRVTPDGFLKLMDFGIARSETDRQDLMTQTRSALGTPAYMAPEQFEDRGTRQSDVYGLCATFYELYTRRKLHDQRPNPERQPTPPHRVRPGIGWELSTLLMAGLDVEPASRPTARALAEDLERIQTSRPIRFRRTPLGRRATLWYRRNRRAVNVLAPVLFVVLAVATYFGIKAYAQQERAEQLEGQVGELGQAVKTEQKKRIASDEKSAKSEARALTAEQLKYYREYVADMQLIPSLWKDARVDLIRERLRRYPARTSDPRGFEWYYWDRVVNANGQQWKAAGRVTSLDWSTDGRTLYSTDVTGRLTAWDRATGKTRTVRDARSRTKRVTAGPGNTLAAVLWSQKGFDPAIQVLKEEKPAHTITANRLSMFEVAAISPDGKRLYAGTLFGRIPCWNLETGRPLLDLVQNDKSRRNPLAPSQLLDVHGGAIRSLAVSPNGELVASGGEDGRVGLWNASGQFRGWLRGHEGEVVSVVFSADGSKLLTRSIPRPPNLPGRAVSRDGEVIVWSLASESVLRKIALLKPSPSLIARSPDGAAGFLGGDFRAEFTDSGRAVVVADGNVVRVIDHASGEARPDLIGHEAPIVSLKVCPRTGRLATADESGEVRIWDLRAAGSEEVVHRLGTPGRQMRLPLRGDRLAILQDAHVGASSRGVESPSVFKKLTLHALTDFAAREPENPSEQTYLGLACSPSGRYVVCGKALLGSTLLDVAHLWDMQTGKLVRKLPKGGHCWAFRGEDEVYLCRAGSLWRMNVQTGESEAVKEVSVGPSPGYEHQSLKLPPEAVMAIAFSPDGSRAAFGQVNGDIVVYDPANWKMVARLRGHSRGVTCLAFSPDGKRLASCSGRYFTSQLTETGHQPGEVIVWDTPTWQNCLTLSRKAPHEFLGVGFANDGRTLYALVNRLESGASRLPRGELIRWETGSLDAEPAIQASPPAAPAKSLAGRTFRSNPGVMNFAQMRGYEAVAVHPEGSFLAALTVGGQLVLWDGQTTQIVREMQTTEVFAFPLGRLTFSADGQRLLFSKSTHASVYSVPGLKLIQERKRPPFSNILNSAVRGSDGQLVTLEASTADRTFALVAGGKSKTLEVGRYSLSSFSPDARHLLAVNQPNPYAKGDNVPRQVRMLSLEDGKALFTAACTGHVQQCGFSRNGKTCYVLAVAEADAKLPTAGATLQRWSVPSGEKLPDVRGLRYPAFLSPDLQMAVVRKDASNLHAIDLTTGKESDRQVAVEGRVRGVHFLPDGKHFATFGDEAQVRLWDARRTRDLPPGAAPAQGGGADVAVKRPARKRPAAIPAMGRKATVAGGTWVVEKGMLVQKNATDGNILLLFGDPSWRDYDYSFEAVKTQGRFGVSALFRAADLRNYMLFDLAGFQNRRYSVEGFTDGQHRWGPRNKAGAMRGNGVHRVLVKVRGDRFQCYVNDTLIYDFRDSRNASGGVGFRCWGAAVQISEIEVRSPDGKPLWQGAPELGE
jgi:WD40 repeat protein